MNDATDTTPRPPAPEAVPEMAGGDALPAPLAEVVVAVEELRKQRKKDKKKEKKADKKEGNESTLGTSRGVETMFRTSYLVNMDLSALADTKSNIMISINGIIISILLASISPKIDSNAFLLIPTTVLLLGCLSSIIYAVLAARPRVSSKLLTLDDVRARRANILFFGNFARLDEEAFVGAMTDLMRNTDALYMTMIRDLYSLGVVLHVKYKLLRTSYTLFIIGLVAGVLSYLAAFFINAGTAPPAAF